MISYFAAIGGTLAVEKRQSGLGQEHGDWTKRHQRAQAQIRRLSRNENLGALLAGHYEGIVNAVVGE